MGRQGRFLVALAVAALAPAATAGAMPHTTVERTVQDCDGDNLLEMAPGEPHVAPDASDPGACVEDRTNRRLRLPRQASLLNFLQLSDFQIVDEESPARVEFLDTTQRAPGLNPFSAAYRPQESLTTQITEAMVRNARNTTSPVTGARLDLTILTGDNADSQQYNETRWFIDILDGTTGPGNPDPEMDDERPGADRKIVPDSGIEAGVASCKPAALPYTDNGSIYDGVRGGGARGVNPDPGYYEPDGEGDGDGYMPDRVDNVREVPGPHADVTLRDFPGLFERAQERFEAVGLGMPWYTAFGNHDALVQGNSSAAYFGPSLETAQQETVNPGFDAIARGCVKPSKYPVGVPITEFFRDPAAYIRQTAPVVVPPDPRRCYVAKDVANGTAAPCSTGGWIQQHSRTTGAPVGHGFEPFAVDGQAGPGRPLSARTNHDGYYSFVPRPGFRFLVLDTVTDECGTLLVCSEGSVDDAQFRWAEDQLNEAKAVGQYVFAFSHHTLRTTRMPSSDPSEYPLHYGERASPPESASPPAGDTLEDLWCRHPNLVAHVVGHEHANDVRHHTCQDSPSQANPFYEISTAAHIDWPQQSRMIEAVNSGGKLSLVLTILDHDGPAYPGEGVGTPQPVRLASIGREIAYNDYQNSRTSRGARADRNVIIETGKPAALSPPTPPTP